MTTHSLPKTPQKLREDIAHLQLLFSIQQYVLLGIVRKLTDQQLVTLATETELLVPITDEEVNCSLSILADIDQFGTIEVALNQLGDGVRLAFELHTNIQYDEDIPRVGVYPFLVSIHIIPAWRRDQFEDHELEEEVQEVLGPVSFWGQAPTALDEIVIDKSKWQQETARHN